MATNQSFKCRDLTTLKVETQQICMNNLTLSNNNRYINVKDKSGKDVFWVDDDGASISALETQTDFVSLTDTANSLGESNSLIMVKDGKLDFSRDLDLNSLKANQIKTDKLVTKSVNLDSVVSKSVLGENATLDTLHADEISSRAINTSEMLTKKLKCDNFKTELLEVINNKCEKLIAEDIVVDNFISKELSSNTGNIAHLKTQEGKVSNLQADQINGNNGNFDKGSFNELEAVDFKTIHLKALDGKINELELERLIVKHQEYGSLTAPLYLALTQTKSLALHSPYNYHKIVTKVPTNVKTQSFFLENLNFNKEWKVSVTLTKDNEVQSTLIMLENNHKLNLSYKKVVEENTMAIILIIN